MRYEPASRVALGPQPGALALRDYAHSLGFGDAGIFNPRNVRGSTSTLSLHAEGRAVDLTPGSRGAGALTELVHRLVEQHQQLGVQQVIWQRSVWTVGRGWRPYSGTDPHTGHAHVELTRSAAAGLTVDTLREVLDPQEVTVMSGNRIDVFVRGDDGAVWHKWFDLATFSWSPWESLGGQCVGAPTAAWFAGTLHVFVRGTDDAMWQRAWSPASGWGDWFRHEGTLTSAPAVAVG